MTSRHALRTPVAAVATADPPSAAPVSGASFPAGGRAATGSHTGGRTGRPIVIGHRGASGYRPEHTLASYELAAQLGADFIEPDLVPTRDGVLVCRHEPEISGTTDVADHPEFAGRRRTVVLDGRPVAGWFTEDFTLAELKTLRVKERLPRVRRHNTLWDGRFEIPTFDEVLDLRLRLCRELGRELGVYPETKHPTYFRTVGLPLEQRLLDALHGHGLNTPDAPVFVQSFEVTNLRQLRTLGLRTPVTQLVSASGSPFDSIAGGGGPTYADLITPAGLESIATYAQGIGPDKNLIIPRTAGDTLTTPTTLVADSHAKNLFLHPYTFRTENAFLPADHRSAGPVSGPGRAVDEQITFLQTGVDGFFTDQPDVGLLARERFLAGDRNGG